VLRPYVGGSASVLFAYDAHVTNPFLTAVHQPDMSIHAPNLPLFDTVEVGTAKVNVWVNPFLVQAGVGVDF
jgi:predicted oxidoreductase (fatty acid repression mutant protein)